MNYSFLCGKRGCEIKQFCPVLPLGVEIISRKRRAYKKIPTYSPGEVRGQFVLDDKVEDGAGGVEPPLQEQDDQGGVHHQELTACRWRWLLTHSSANQNLLAIIDQLQR
jgi:hypothetical protein